MKFDGNCLLPSNLEKVKKAQFFVAGAEKEIRPVLTSSRVLVDFKTLALIGYQDTKQYSKTLLSFFLDDIKLDYFSRNRDWVHAANLRIDDLRTIDLHLTTEDLEGVDRLEINMLDSDFKWGGMFDQYMPRGLVSLPTCE